MLDALCTFSVKEVQKKSPKESKSWGTQRENFLEAVEINIDKWE